MTRTHELPLTYEDLLQHIRSTGEWSDIRAFLVHAGLPVGGEDAFIAESNPDARIGGLGPVAIAVLERLENDHRVTVVTSQGITNEGIVTFKVDKEQVPRKKLEQHDPRATYHWVG